MANPPQHKYLDFTRKERRGILLLLGLILLLTSAPFLYPFIFTGKVKADTFFDSSLAILQSEQAAAKPNYSQASGRGEQRHDEPSSSYYKPRAASSKGSLFSFDPNTISAEGWKKLGLRDQTITAIVNYRNKGGKFKKAEDIKKIWGLFPDEAERLLPYIKIAPGTTSTAGNYSNNFPASKKYETPKVYSPVDINYSDTSAWIALPGIGSKLSQRIVSFRDKLGGFYSVSQVGETFGLPDSVFQKIKPLLQISGNVKKININTVTLDELKTHPYVRYQLANAIVQYRKQHGLYKEIADIQKIMIISDEIFNQLLPYLSVE
jgi:competence protein ComEA